MNSYEALHYLRGRVELLRTTKTSWNRLRWCIKDLDAVDALTELARGGLAHRHDTSETRLDGIFLEVASTAESPEERQALAEALAAVLEGAVARAARTRAGTRAERILRQVEKVSPRLTL